MNSKNEQRSPWLDPEPIDWFSVVEEALQEDVGLGDITGSCIPIDQITSWHLESQADGVLAGVGVVEALMGPQPSDPEQCNFTLRICDGEKVSRGSIIAEGIIPARRALMMERTSLNFVMHLSGIATLTHTYVSKIKGTRAKIIDTRKTTPGLRVLEKYAVRCGGGHNHRMGLHDGILIKDNHIQACGSIQNAVEKVKSFASHFIRIEVECERLDQVEEAINAGAEIVMLDNMDPFMMREAVSKFKGRCLLEASGGINLDTVKGVAATGVDLISVGAITHSAPALACHIEFMEC